MTIQDIILFVINKHSGGCKFMEFSLHVGRQLFLAEHPICGFIDPMEDNFPAELLSTIRSMPELEILTYVHKTGNLDKLKYFIYRPLPPTTLEATQRLSIPKQVESIAA